MESAEFLCTRESLGLSHLWLSDWLWVNERTVREWEAGRSPAPAWAAEALEELALITTSEMRRRLADAKVLERDHVWVTYRTDGDYRDDSLGQIAYAPAPYKPGDDRPKGKHLPASWHRALVSMCRAEVGGGVTFYVPADQRV